ncbi:MAG: hypothetical protein UR93_C0004G0011 [Berkelbacteria bacterium GW2011_GWA2_35_9]|uniref:ATP-dependent Clp protease proteolytic subunit n=1 Tax=Berkelbacteria bacterium GW2011_GWA2_35_9 TaxID=1618333 RepID=A0A0G0D6V8_9BACT|nr:MAG: hypothetical protein UR93_C0004G0011 [Berkelbacteria bacterium GW2011_GWA2_35_9]
MEKVSFKEKRIILITNEIGYNLLRKIRTSRSKKPIIVVINSCGGDLGSAYKIAQYLQNRSATAIVTGVCNSATIPILLACSKRYCLPTATIFFHSLKMNLNLKIIDFLDKTSTDSQIERALEIHNTYVNLIASQVPLEPEDITQFMREEIVLKPSIAIELGFLDARIDSFSY